MIRRRWKNEATPTGEAGAAWALLQAEGKLTKAQEHRLARWVSEDSGNARALEDSLWALDALEAHAAEPEILAFRHAALMDRGVRKRRAGWASVAAVLAALLVFMTVQFAPKANSPRVTPALPSRPYVQASGPGMYQTGLGESSQIRLPDGSTATLDTNTKVRVAYSDAERAVYLLRGQALFDVAHRKPMPFRVYAGTERITAVGTVFNVRLDGNVVRVAMVEGTVKVHSLAPRLQGSLRAPVEQILTAGEALSTLPDAPIVIASVNIPQVTSWKSGVLTFEDTPLSEAVSEINRYTAEPIAIADGAVGRHRISGLFHSSDPDRFAQAASEIFPVEVARSREGGLILRSRTD